VLRTQPARALFAPRAGVSDALAKLDARNIAGAAAPSPGLGAGLPTTFIGSPDTVVEQVRRCRDEVGAGVLDVLLQPAGSTDVDLLMRSLELFGRKVLPRIRDI
jgi:alkanesulfonate monooxygenase SsuD/methylene tetrahydromethanopterin reductase-like flavin-dependent oxidoreductase (luciferase family)